MKKTLFMTFAMFAALTVFSPSVVSAQKEKRIDVGKTGQFHLDSSLRVGGVLLESGMYQAKYITEGGDSFVVFREVEMNKYGRSMGSLKVGDVAAKIKCAVESVDGQNKNAKILVRRNSANQREAVEIWFRNEKVKYILPKS